jgi:hypothetical protein
MRRAKWEGRRIGRAPPNINREQVVADRCSGMSLTQAASKHRISRASVCGLVNESGRRNNTDAQGVGSQEISILLPEKNVATCNFTDSLNKTV